jgi:hypothetical protein
MYPFNMVVSCGVMANPSTPVGKARSEAISDSPEGEPGVESERYPDCMNLVGVAGRKTLPKDMMCVIPGQQ